jgi:hypothetical protein
MILLFLFLDIQYLPVSECPNQDFTVTEIKELSLTGCTFSPSGGTNNVDLTVDWVDPLKEQMETSLPMTLQELQPSASVIPMRMIADEPQIPVTLPKNHEPPSVAILTMTGLALLYLIFGFSRRLRQYR